MEPQTFKRVGTVESWRLLDMHGRGGAACRLQLEVAHRVYRPGRENRWMLFIPAKCWRVRHCEMTSGVLKLIHPVASLHEVVHSGTWRRSLRFLMDHSRVPEFWRKAPLDCFFFQ